MNYITVYPIPYIESLMDDPEDSNEFETDEDREYWDAVQELEREQILETLIEYDPDEL